ncbi:cytochrome P450 [Nonomuraea endophytica]|uniref:cytochrome P450 n=1 Tax=Nonomuraea endophytica TaxID=714136 RepID=UPI0037C5B0E6
MSETPTTLRGWPLVGSAPGLLRDPLGFFSALPAHGDVVAIRLGPLKMYVVNHPDLVRQVLVNQAHAFDKGRHFEKLRLWWGNGLSTSEGAFHQRQRRLMQPAFHRRQVAGYVEDMRRAARRQVGSWPAGKVIQLDRELYALLVTMITENLFSTSIDDRATATLQSALPIILDWVGWLTLDTTDLLGKLPIPANRRFRHAVEAMNATVDAVIDHHPAGRTDLLSMLRNARDADTGQSMSRQQIRDEVITLMMTGSETTRTVLSWSCHLLSTHPGVQAAVQAEADRVLRGRPPEAADLDHLALTRRVITEAMRMYPITWLLTRRAATDVELGPYRIPAGSALCYSEYVLHRDPVTYPGPDRFDPDRWLPDRDPPPRGAYIPFGAGIRSCIGEPVAWAQATVILATIAQTWTLHPAPGPAVKPLARMLLMPQRLPMILQPCHAAGAHSHSG